LDVAILGVHLADADEFLPLLNDVRLDVLVFQVSNRNDSLETVNEERVMNRWVGRDGTKSNNNNATYGTEPGLWSSGL
jgi:hypothetical protein